MRVLGTAGHVDHGKSALVQALTGMNPDRLQEEIDRQMTIDLGFAWMTLSNGEEVGIIDVPGHRDFIENMLAGVGGFDAALLVIAADEGIMPQTREHLSILDLLEIEQGVVALTKTDLIEDPEWLELVQEDVERILKNTTLAGSPIVPVSAKSGDGLDHLIAELAEILRKASPRMDIGKPRLPIDRAFSISGFGTVVTGTLKSGSFNVGDEVEILPGSIKGRIRGLQTHKVKVQSATPGSRTAVNISGVDVRQIFRGDVVSLPTTYSSTTMIDVQYRHVPGINVSLKHDQRVKVYIGAAQRTARVRLLGVDRLHPGQSAFLQLMIDEPVVADRGDHFILRRPSPGLTMGGGKVIDALPKRRHRRFDEELLDGFESLARGDPADLIAQYLLRTPFSTVGELVDRSGISVDEAMPILRALISEGEVVILNTPTGELGEGDLIVHQRNWEELVGRFEDVVSEHHAKFPLRMGMSREELKSRIGEKTQVFSSALKRLAEEGKLEVSNLIVSRGDFKPQLTKSHELLARKLQVQFDADPFGPPSVKESKKVVGEDLYTFLIESGELIQVSEEVVFRNEDYQLMVKKIREVLVEKETVTVAEIRDMFDTTRKFALALMEHLDEIGVTVREGDVRRLMENRSSS